MCLKQSNLINSSNKNSSNFNTLLAIKIATSGIKEDNKVIFIGKICYK